MTSAKKAETIMAYTHDVGNLYEVLNTQDREALRYALAPPDTFQHYLQTKPSKCLLSGSLVSVIIGIAIGMAIASSNQSIRYRGTSSSSSSVPSASCQRTVERMLDYV